MKDFFRRYLALALILSLVLSTGPVCAFATGSDGSASVLNTDNAITASPDADQELIGDVLEDAINEIDVFDPDENVVFIMALEGQSLLDTKPDTLTVRSYIDSSAGIKAVQSIEAQQASVQTQINRSRTTGLTIEYTYQVVMNGFAVSGPYSAKSYLESLDGVASVTVAQTYAYVEPVDGYNAAYRTSGAMIDSDSANAAGYTGKGTVTAILDTGLDLTHSAFANAPEAPAMELADIEAAVDTGNLNAMVTADQLYKSEKIPFAYDYTSDDANVNDPISHGTHVAGSVGADCTEFSGVAPDTQLVIMKIFNDQGSGASSAVIFAALEDAMVLGVDTINMSLGTPSGFTSEDAITDAVYNSVMDAGVNLMVSAGNETSATYYNNLGTDLPLVSEPDNGVVGSPATYSASLAVASVNEYQNAVDCIQAGDDQIAFTDINAGTSMGFVDTFDGQTLEYVLVDGYGTADDFAAVDVTGKIALVSRGELAFNEKEYNAYDAGAVGLIVFDNAEGQLLEMDVEGWIPAIFISMADGEVLKAQETKTISVAANSVKFVDTADGGLISSFSSLGVAPDMTLKPEITAPGGYVYSTLPGGGYGSMSGTSMAAPHMAGAAAVLRQYADAEFESLSEAEKMSLINTLLMNTAAPLEDEYGVTYTPRKQGAGLAQVGSAINTGAYVTVNGSSRPKAQLGDSPSGSFSKKVTLTVHNISDTALTYDLSAIPLTAQEQTVKVNGVTYNCISEYARVMPADQLTVSYSADSVTVPAGGTASVTVTLTLTDAGKASLASFTNGTFLEGYIVLESANADGIDLSVPYLGFYGDWGQASVYDDTAYEDELASVYASSMALLDINSGDGFYLGGNLYTDETAMDSNKIAVSRAMLGDYTPYTLLGLLRAPKSLTYTVTDADGNVLELLDWLTFESLGTSYTVENVLKSFYYYALNGYNYEVGPTDYGWCPVVDMGDGSFAWCEDGQYYINITAQVDGTDSAAGSQSLSFPITLDSVAPQLVSYETKRVDGVPYLTLDLYDEHYIMAFQLVSTDGTTALSSIIPVDEAEAGTTTSYTFDTSVLLEEGYTSAVVVALDYALNELSSEEIDLNAEESTEPTYEVTYTSASISLAGDIGVNYYAQLSEDLAAAEGAYMEFTVAGKTQTVPVSEAEVDADGIYRFTCKVAAKQMTDTIVGQMYLADGTAVGEAKSYSVKAYCDAAIPAYSQYEDYAELVALMEAMLNYGGYSQVQFAYNTDNLANADLADTSLPTIAEADVAAYAHGATGSESGISVASVSLLLESNTTIRFYFNLDGSKSIDQYTFYVDGVEVTPVASNGQYYVDKVNVAAKDLDEMATVTVGDLTVQYCGLSYVRQVAVLYPSYYSESLVNVAKALYAYNQAANAYFA